MTFARRQQIYFSSSEMLSHKIDSWTSHINHPWLCELLWVSTMSCGELILQLDVISPSKILHSPIAYRQVESSPWFYIHCKKTGGSVTEGLMFLEVSQPRKETVKKLFSCSWSHRFYPLVSSGEPIRIVFLAWASPAVYYWWIFLQVLANELLVHMIYVIRHRYQLEA